MFSYKTEHVILLDEAGVDNNIEIVVVDQNNERESLVDVDDENAFIDDSHCIDTYAS